MKREHDLEINDERIVRYLAGESGPEEAMALHDWIDLSAENHARFETLKSTWDKANPSRKIYSTDDRAAWLRIQTARPSKNMPLRPGILYWRVAASVIVLLAAGISVYIGLRPVSKEKQLEILTADAAQHVSFPDQSTAVLYHHTKIIYPKIFNPSKREVSLEKGEAYFKIQPDARVPFIIHTNLAEIRVVGTAFNVIITNTAVEVSVEEGKVRLGTTNDSTYLEAGQTGTIRVNHAQSDARIDVKNSVRENTWAYATHQLVFRNTPLPRVISDIEKAYGYSIKIKNPLISNCKLTATFENDSAENLLNLIAETLNLSVRGNDRVFYLEGEGCP